MPPPTEPTPDGGSVPSGRSPLSRGAWRLFPYRGRFLSASTRYVYERLPEAPASFTAADVALLCVEAEQTLDLDSPCNPAEVIDLLTSRALVAWTDAGFVKRARRPRPRA